MTMLDSYGSTPKAGQIRDPSWLMLEVCREFLRGTCSRSETDCKFAHPPQHVFVENGKVTACFDATKNRCNRDSCKYFHAPAHLQAELERNGKFNLVRIQLQCLQSQMLPNAAQSAALRQMAQNPSTFPQTALSYLVPWQPSYNQLLFQQNQLPSLQMQADVPSSEGVVSPKLESTAESLKNRVNKLPVCPNFLIGSCDQTEEDCGMAHPEQRVTVDSSDQTVTVCMDFIYSKCSRPTCKYFHPPANIKNTISQQSLNNGMVASSAAEVSPVSPNIFTYPATSPTMQAQFSHYNSFNFCTNPLTGFNNYIPGLFNSLAFPNTVIVGDSANYLANQPNLYALGNPVGMMAPNSVDSSGLVRCASSW